jgi:DNA-binding SARP family transcriptional activator/tetratricopeptide (TPR) repeat protein
MSTLRLTLLGGFDARLAAGNAVGLPTRKAQALLAYLGQRPGQTHQRDKLAALLWGERSDQHARDGLRHVIAALRKALADVKPPAMLVVGRALALNPKVVEVDVVIFERRVAEGTPAALEQAAELYRGDLLLGFTVSEPLFEEWLVAERERLREVALEALARLLAHQTRTGETERAIQTALRLLGLDPLQEAVHRTLMRLYVRQARRGAALKQYQICVGVLQRELGAEPETETKRLYQELLRRPAEVVKAADSRVDRDVPPAPKPEPARLDLPAAETPLFGRETELGRLRQLLDETMRGHGHLATVMGEAGIGKTRLLGALASEALDRGSRVLMGRCYESDSILPFGLWVDACRRGGLSVDEEVLGALPPLWRAEVTRLLPEATAPGLPPPSNIDLRLFEGMSQLVEQVAVRQPLVLMLEDLHWADEMSLRLLAFVGRRIATWAALVVTTAREEELADTLAARRTVHELYREAQVVPLVLPPLSHPDTTRLVQALARAGSDARVVARLEQQVWAVSEGNPFVAVETTRALQEGAALPEAGTIPLPQRVRELVARRLERLSDGARELAATAAVIGREFEFALLQRAGGIDEHATAQGVEELVRRHVLRGVGERFDFSHHRVHAVVYDQLLPPQRRLRHRRVGEALEALHAGNLEPHYVTLGTHFREGAVWDKAVGFFQQAGASATARSASREAVACFGQALGALGQLPDSPATMRLAIDLKLELFIVLAMLGEHGRVLDCAREAEGLAGKLGDEPRLARISCQMAFYLWGVGDLRDSVAWAERALALADRLGDVALTVMSLVRLGLICITSGEFRRAIGLLKRCIDLLEGAPLTDNLGLLAHPAIACRNYTSYSLACLGEFSAARAMCEEAIRIAGANGQPYVTAHNDLLGAVDYLQGNVTDAISALEHGLDLSRREGFAFLTSGAATHLGRAYLLCGRAEEAATLLEEAVAQSATANFMAIHPLAVVALGEAYLQIGRREEATSHAQRGLELSRAHGARPFEAEAMRLLGAIDADHGPEHARESEAWFRAALAVAADCGMRPLGAHCHLSLGKLYRRTARRNDAREHLTIATTMYCEMGMRLWLDLTESELQALVQ